MTTNNMPHKASNITKIATLDITHKHLQENTIYKLIQKSIVLITDYCNNKNEYIKEAQYLLINSAGEVDICILT